MIDCIAWVRHSSDTRSPWLWPPLLAARRLLEDQSNSTISLVFTMSVEPEVSPDGKWIAYTVSSVDKEADKRDTELWMVSWDGTQNIQLTNSPESESSPRWSPDGKYISFTSSRPGKAKGNQVWVLDRRGGEARQLTDVKGAAFGIPMVAGFEEAAARDARKRGAGNGQ